MSTFANTVIKKKFHMSLINALKWRYATKKMTGRVVPQENVDQIVEAAHLAPTSSGLQPFKVIVVSNADLKAKIAPIANNQSQIIDGSHLLIFAAWDNYTEERIRSVFANANTERGLPASTTADYENMLVGAYTNKTAEENFHHAAKQAYIGFGIALAEAALLGVDATPMEGFNPAQLDELLGLNELGLRSTTILALGFRDASADWLVNLKKVRTPKEQFVIEYK
ncbi:nitroreductase [Pedobacter duraquae]|uniref:Nitroreductase n=2 Tax=Pedobacter duraquae TaxID=425511 RepID=A0A4R6IIA5_9SPHI|nr:nitroreductase [Pedobacter duraquae]